MKVNSITISKQATNITDRKRDKEKEKFRPILPYYIINNRKYFSHYNSPKNQKAIIHKKKEIINNFKDINIKTKNYKNMIKNNSSSSSYNNFNYNYSKHNINSKRFNKNEMNLNSCDYSPSIKDRILLNSKNNLKINSTNGGNKAKNNTNIDLLKKKIANPIKQKSSHDILYNENKKCYTLNNSEAKKKNKKKIMTSLSNSKDYSSEKIKINSKKKFHKFNYKNYSCKPKSIGGNINNKLLLNISPQMIRSKNLNTKNNNALLYNSSNKIGKIYKKNHAKFINNELFHPDKKRQGMNFFMNYLKGVNNIKSNNSNSYKSISININSTGNIIYKKPKIKIDVTELKNEYINKEYNNLLSNPSSNKNKINSNSSIKSSRHNPKISKRTFSINEKKENKNGFSNLGNLNNKNFKQNSLNNSKINLKKLLSKYQIDSPLYKYANVTIGNNLTLNNTNHNNINNKLNNGYKSFKSPQNFKNISKSKYITNTNVDNNKKYKNDNTNVDYNYSIKINKILRDSMQEISKIRSNFIKHFTANNSPNQKNLAQAKKDLENNNNDGNLYMPKMFDSNYNNKKSLKKKKNVKNSHEKKSNNSKNKIYSSKIADKKNKIKTKYLTQKNSKINIKKIKEPKIPKLNLNIQAKNNSVLDKYNSTLTQSSRSGIHDSFYYLRESQKLSNYIKSYSLKNKKYPETNLNFYKYGRLIGQGAFGKVNLGLHILTGRVVAIKSFNKSNLNSNSENMKKITYETNLMKKLNHPNITKILELFEDKDYILIIMEYINGGNLFSFVKKRRKVSEKTAKFLFKQIILGIKHIHSHNIVHRDIKLENILIDLNNNIKICDFGIGRVLTSPDQLLFDQCGTPMYIAPEILLSTKETGYKGFPVDIWSSGIALYILLSGTLPFSFKNGSSISIEESEKNNHNNTEELQFAIVNNEPKYIENISEEARDLLRGLLNKNPEKRLTCNEILAHPWLKDIKENLDNNKYHLFTKAEMKILSKTYVDYRKDKNDNLKENFSLSNLFKDSKDKSKSNEKNEETKSSILAPFNSIIEDDEDELNFDNFDFMDDLNNDKILLENGIISIGHKVKEFNMLYEMNNNCEFDNGIIINSKTNSVISETNNSINTIISDSLPKNYDQIWKEDKRYTVNNNINNFTIKAKKLIKDNNNKNKENQEKNKILNQLESLGYNKNYVKECIKNNVLCYASTAYFLMLNYDKI